MPSERLPHLEWPFLEDHHRSLARDLDAWAAAHVAHIHSADVDNDCRTLVRTLGQAGWLRHAVAGTAHGGAGETLDTRTLCLIRETLARHNGQRWRFQPGWLNPMCDATLTGRCLLHFSPDGGDRTVLREFDLRTRRLREDGFRIDTPARTYSHWVDADHVLIASDFGPGSLSSAGYALQSRLWRRGQPLSEALHQPVVIENLPGAGGITGTTVEVIGATTADCTPFTSALRLMPSNDSSEFRMPADASLATAVTVGAGLPVVKDAGVPVIVVTSRRPSTLMRPARVRSVVSSTAVTVAASRAAVSAGWIVPVAKFCSSVPMRDWSSASTGAVSTLVFGLRPLSPPECE